MYLDPNWRILTVGDGDLSFSHALHTGIKPKTLVASTYDDAITLTQKYADNALATLAASNVTVLNGFDVTNPKAWQRLNGELFDVVIFQFPLVPAFVGETAFRENTTSINTLNRALLHQFIKYASNFALDNNGPMLCYITSKDVKPYREWNIEGTLNHGLASAYLGQMPFDISSFPGYKIRNVDRDKHVKDTSGISYVFSPKKVPELKSKLTIPTYLNSDSCALCRVGPFHCEEDKQKHLLAKKHRQMLAFEADWQAWLAQFNHQEQS
ncbi:class I SAM-dependent methyltransferase [Pseudoalteromonas haloplanktis]|uniref:Class I SAM-dependent methyltransferase n=1 Tax=Pseudoalteromonas haloplanktis TaxID=228 RepID=A0ABU1BBF9_PSEHA|nr:class I SAM-dependent methyltransferase [Pseudoalteromonas haloplanktis]MDQ9091592.1 class I SAM-dependent methyltransferase [Pseudoalteromonas haloplanktis]